MQLICAGLDGKVDESGRSAELSGEGITLNLEFLDRVKRDLHCRHHFEVALRIHAVNEIADGHFALTGDCVRQPLALRLPCDRTALVALNWRRPRADGEQLQVVPAVQRELFNVPLPNNLTKCGIVGLNKDNPFGVYSHSLTNLAEFQLHIEACLLVYLEYHGGDNCLPESSTFAGYVVASGQQQRELVISSGISQYGTA